MKKMIFTMLVLVSMATAASAQGTEYKILDERDITITFELSALKLGTRDVHHILY